MMRGDAKCVTLALQWSIPDCFHLVAPTSSFSIICQEQSALVIAISVTEKTYNYGK